MFVRRARSKQSLEKFTLYNYIHENHFCAFSTHERKYFYTKKHELQYVTSQKCMVETNAEQHARRRKASFG